MARRGYGKLLWLNPAASSSAPDSSSLTPPVPPWWDEEEKGAKGEASRLG